MQMQAESGPRGGARLWLAAVRKGRCVVGFGFYGRGSTHRAEVRGEQNAGPQSRTTDHFLARHLRGRGRAGRNDDKTVFGAKTGCHIAKTRQLVVRYWSNLNF
jgi:hypothetical protein